MSRNQILACMVHTMDAVTAHPSKRRWGSPPSGSPSPSSGGWGRKIKERWALLWEVSQLIFTAKV